MLKQIRINQNNYNNWKKLGDKTGYLEACLKQFDFSTDFYNIGSGFIDFSHQIQYGAYKKDR